MCDFRLNINDLRGEFGARVDTLTPTLVTTAKTYAPFVTSDGTSLQITPQGRPLTRIVASALDQHVPEGVRYSRAS
jgi:oxygen-independent coproporphyrinogen-3 oxidase